MSKKLNLAVIFGGRSGEHEVSIVSAKSVIREADKKKYNVKEIFINKNGEWILDNKKTNPTESLKETDVVFPVLHGPLGEDGAIQGFLELSDVPYVGAGVAASAVCMDKVLMKEVFEGVGLPITRCLVFLRDSIEENEDVIKWTISKFPHIKLIKQARIFPDGQFTAFFYAMLQKTIE